MPTDSEAPQRGSPLSGQESESIDLPEPGLGAQAASGVLWTTAQKWLLRITGLATLAILTRLITPEEFGVVAAAMTVLPLLYLVADLGFSTYLVQADRVDQRSLSTGLWFSVSASVGLMAVLLVAAPLVAKLLSVPEVTPVLRVLASSVVVSGLSVVPVTLLKRRMAFRTLARQGAVAGGLAQVVAVTLAFSGAGVWTLVGQQLVSQVVMLILAWRSAAWLPSMRFSVPVFKEMAAFGVRVSTVELLNAARSWTETAIIAAVLGPVALGYVNIAQRLVQVMQELGASAILPVSVVAFAKIRQSRDRLVAGYFRALGMVYALASPLLTAVAVTAPLLVPLLFGDQWGASVPFAQALAVAAILTLGATLDHGLFLGLGRAGRWLGYAVVIDTLSVAATAVAVSQGLAAVAVAFLIVALIATAARWPLVGSVLGCSWTYVARPLGLATVVTATSALAGWLVLQQTTGWTPLAAIALTSAVVGISHLSMTRLLQKPLVGYCVSILPVPASLQQVLRRLLCLPPAQLQPV